MANRPKQSRPGRFFLLGASKAWMTIVGISSKLGICQSAVGRLSKRGESIASELRVDLVEGKS